MIPLTAPVVEVTVLEDRARVTRRGAIALAAGQHRLVVADVAPVLVDKTLLAVADGARVLDARCRRRRAPWRTGDADARDRATAAASLAAEEQATAEAVARLAAELAVAERELADVAALRGVALAELAAEAAWGRLPDGASALLARLDERERDATAIVAARRLELDRARRDLDALRARATAAASVAGVETADLILDVVADAAGAATITIAYLVPGACWRPSHTATLRGDEVTIATDACVWQHTGEDWHGAVLRCSTERPSLGATPPRLVDDEVRVQRRSDVVVVDARDEEIETTGLGGGERSLRAAAEVPGVDDGGVSTVLVAAHPATIPSDGRPYRVPLGAHTTAAALDLVAMPERAACVIARTRQANGPRPLLAGPVDLVRDGGHVGRTSILYVAPGERFELGWGPEADLRLHREERRRREEAGMLSWSETRVRVAVRLSNLGDAARAVEVVERVPVSELDKVEIVLGPADGDGAWRLEDDDGAPPVDDVPVVTARTVDDDGLVRWRVELPARARRAVALEYRIRAHGSVVGL